MGNSQRERLLVRAARRIDDGAPAARVCRELGVGESQLAAWRWSLAPDTLLLAQRVAELEWENRLLRSTIGDLRTHRQLLLEAFNLVFPAPKQVPEHTDQPNGQKRASNRDRGHPWVM